MAIIKIKSSSITAQPGTDALQVAEPAYSYVSDKLWIGYADGTGGTDAVAVGGAAYANLLNHALVTNQVSGATEVDGGTLTANRAIVVDVNKHIDEIIAGGLTLTTSGGIGQKVTSISTDLTLSANATDLATAAAIKTYVDNNVSDVSIDDLTDVALIASAAAGQVLIYNATSGQWENKTFSGDVTISANGTTDITASGVTAATYGSSIAIPRITIAADGRITAANTVDISTTLTVAADSGTGDGVDLLTDTLTVTGNHGIETSLAGDTITVSLFAGGIANDRLTNPKIVITGDAAATDDVNLGETLTFTGGTGITSAVSSNAVTFTLDDQIGSSGSVGSSTAIPVISYNAQGQITAVTTANVGTSLSISDVETTPGTDTVDLLTDTLTFTGGTGITSAVTNNNVTFNLDDQITAGTAGGASSIPVLAWNAQGQLTSVTTASVASELTIVGDGGNSTTIELLTEGLTIAGGTGLTSSVDDALLPNIITVTLDDTAVTAGSYGDANHIPTFTVDDQGRLTLADEIEVNTSLTIAADTGLIDDNVGTVASGETLTIVGGIGLTTTLADNSITVDLDDTAVTPSQYGSVNAGTGEVFVPTFVVDQQGRIQFASHTQLDASTIKTINVTDTDSGYSWAATGSFSADSNADTFNIISGYKIDVDIDAASEAIRITNTGVTTLTADTHLSVDVDSGDVTISTDATDANTVSTIVARDASGDFASNKATLNELQVDNININGNIITSTDTNGNIQLSPNGAGIVDITKNVDVTGDLTIAGNLTVTGTTNTTNVTELVIADPLIHIADGNETSDTIDFGWVGHYSPDAGVTKQHAGIFRNHQDGYFYVFDEYVDAGLDSHTTTDIDTTDASFSLGVVKADSFIGSFSGNASTATTLETARTIALSGDVVGSVSFDGSADVTISATIQPDSVALGTDTTGNYVATLAPVNNGIIVHDSGTETAAVTVELDVASTTFVEGAQDAVGAAVNAGTHTNLTVTYDDATNTINSSVATGTRSVLGVVKFGYINDNLYAADGTTLIQSGGYQFGLDGSGNLQLQEIDGGTF